MNSKFRWAGGALALLGIGYFLGYYVTNRRQEAFKSGKQKHLEEQRIPMYPVRPIETIVTDKDKYTGGEKVHIEATPRGENGYKNIVRMKAVLRKDMVIYSSADMILDCKRQIFEAYLPVPKVANRSDFEFQVNVEAHGDLLHRSYTFVGGDTVLPDIKFSGVKIVSTPPKIGQPTFIVPQKGTVVLADFDLEVAGGLEFQSGNSQIWLGEQLSGGAHVDCKKASASKYKCRSPAVITGPFEPERYTMTIFVQDTAGNVGRVSGLKMPPRR